MLFCPTVQCPEPVGINNGNVVFTDRTVGSIATYACNLGFELIGDKSTTCILVDVDNAEFQPAPPTCRREYTELRVYHR